MLCVHVLIWICYLRTDFLQSILNYLKILFFDNDKLNNNNLEFLLLIVYNFVFNEQTILATFRGAIYILFYCGSRQKTIKTAENYSLRNHLKFPFSIILVISTCFLAKQILWLLIYFITSWLSSRCRGSKPFCYFRLNSDVEFTY